MIFEKIIFYLFIFCLPLQLRLVVYQWGSVFNEWTAAYIYISDLLLLLLLSLWAWRNRKKRFFKKGLKLNLETLNKPAFWLLIFLALTFVSLIRAENLGLGAYKWIKLLEMATLFFYLKFNYRKIFNIRRLGYFLIASTMIQAIIALFQYGAQESLGFHILRESPLNPTLSGVAKFSVENQTLIRAYGTVPHPNILALLFVVAIMVLIGLWIKKEHSFIRQRLIIITFGFLIFGLGLTFSRIAAIGFLAGVLFYFGVSFFKNRRHKKTRQRILSVLFLLIIFIGLFAVLAKPELESRFTVSEKEQAITLRSVYNEIGLSVISQNPILGIGWGNFVWEIQKSLNLLKSWAHQPIHNVYLLIAAEGGLLSMMVFLLFVFQIIKKTPPKNHKKQVIIKRSLVTILLIMLFIGVFDHFLITLQQGQLMLWLTLGLLTAANKS